MSVKAVNWVFERSLSKGNDRLVLIAIADEANDDGANAWPSLDTIAFKAGGIDERTVRRCIRNLEDLGELRVELNAGGKAEWRRDRRPNLYTVLLAHAPKRERTPKRHPRNEGTSCPPANDTRVVPQVTTPGQDCPPDEGTTCPPVAASRGDISAPDGGANRAARGGTGVRQPVLDPTSDPCSTPKPPPSGGSTPRSIGTNPRALATSPRDVGTNPRAQDLDWLFGDTTTAPPSKHRPVGPGDELPVSPGPRSGDVDPAPIGEHLDRARAHLGAPR